jgi:hypothetical protein
MLCKKFTLRTCAVVMVAIASIASAENIIVHLNPSANQIMLGQTFALDVYADIPASVVGWGLDLTRGDEVTMVGLPVIGPAWVPAPSGDGDNLTAFAFPNSVSGTNVMLFSAVFRANSIGTVSFNVLATQGDLTEGFPLQTGGFANFSASIASVEIVPEPATLLLTGLGGIILRRQFRHS